MTAGRSLAIMETIAIADTFASELVQVVQVGPCVRLVFAVLERRSWEEDDRDALTIVSKLVIPAEARERIGRALLASDPLAELLTRRQDVSRI